MTASDKADELIFLFLPYCTSTISTNQDEAEYVKIKYAKQCAIISVNEIMKSIISTPNNYGAAETYWQQVKKEIEKI